jgi:histidine kinase
MTIPRGWLVASVAVWPAVGTLYYHWLSVEHVQGGNILILWIEWGALTPSIIRRAAARLPFGPGAPSAWRAHLGALAAGVIGLFVLNNLVRWLITGRVSPLPAGIGVALLIRMIIAAAYGASLYFATASVVWLVVTEEQALRRQLRVARLTSELAAEELAAMRMRIRPELVVGTLRFIASRTEQRPEIAEEGIHRLCDMLRDVLGGSREEHVSVADAIDSFENYVRLIALAAGLAVVVRRRVDPLILDEPLPARMLELATGGLEIVEPPRLSFLAAQAGEAIHLTAVLRGCVLHELPVLPGVVVCRSERRRRIVVRVVRAGPPATDDGWVDPWWR